MKRISLLLYIVLLSTILWSCKQEVLEVYAPEQPVLGPVVTPTRGSADFSKYVAVGNSLTAGYMNGALYTSGQNNSLAALLARQFQQVGGGAFNQPDIEAVNGFFGVGPGGILLGRLRLSAATGTPAPIIPGDMPMLYGGDKTALNNFGVPGVTLLTALIPQTGGPAAANNAAYNPLYARFASTPGTSTLIGDAAAALSRGGTFFTFWLGNNDVLGYAVSGASNPNILTSVEDFRTRYAAALGAMLSAKPDAKGMIANIPYVTDIPFFRTVMFDQIPLDAASATALNAGYAQFNAGITAYNAGLLPGQTGPPPAEQQRTTISFAAGRNAIVIADKDLPSLAAYGIPSIRQATAADLITLTAGGVLGTNAGGGPVGLQAPLEDQFVLTQREAAQVRERIDAFNAIIAEAAAANTARIGLVDINTIFRGFAQTGFSGNNVYLSAALAPPFGAFSLDGVHPNSRGYAFTANAFIQAINAKWGATIPLVNLASYQGNELPQ
jgi:hypothetical protein